MTTLALRWRGALESLDPADRALLLERDGGTPNDTRAAVTAILTAVRRRGDEALQELTLRFDGAMIDEFEIPKARWHTALGQVDPAVHAALERAAGRIAVAHRAWMPRAVAVETGPGVMLERRPLPLDRVGVYAPGGRAVYPSSVLMGVVPAKAAGVGEVIVCSPPGLGGLPAPLILAAALLGGADRVFALGGAQAVAAMAFGTVTVPRVDRIVGPGNAYVTEAKIQVSDQVGIDSPAGPSEILVIADAAADPAVIADELVAQAEHDPDVVALVVAIGGERIAAPLERALGLVAERAGRGEIVRAALAARGGILSTDDFDAAVQFANEFAAEHLLLALANADRVRHRFSVAGSVFVGLTSSVAFGDYLTGANHVLPTAGAARSHSGLGPEAFVRWVTYQRVSREGAAALAADTVTLARAEGLPGHAAAAARWRAP